MNTFTHIPDALGHALTPMLNVGEITHMHGRTIAIVARSAPKVVSGREIEIPCEYVLHGAEKDWQLKANSPRSTEVKVHKHRRLKLSIWLFTVSMYTNNFTMLSNTRAFTVHCSCTFRRYYWFQLPLNSSLVHHSYSSIPPHDWIYYKTYQSLSDPVKMLTVYMLKSTVIDHEKCKHPLKYL